MRTPISMLCPHLCRVWQLQEFPRGLGVVLGVGKGPTLSLKIMSVRRVAVGHGRLEWRRELATVSWTVLTCFSSLL